MHENLIARVMNMLLSGEDEILGILREQYKNSKIMSIKSSSAGFFVNFDVACNSIDNKKYVCDFQIGDVYGCVDGVESALGFILYIRNGVINMLEGYTNIIDIWPDDNTISLCFDSGCYRNYDALRDKWRYRNED